MNWIKAAGIQLPDSSEKEDEIPQDRLVSKTYMTRVEGENTLAEALFSSLASKNFMLF